MNSTLNRVMSLKDVSLNTEDGVARKSSSGRAPIFKVKTVQTTALALNIENSSSTNVADKTCQNNSGSVEAKVHSRRKSQIPLLLTSNSIPQPKSVTMAQNRLSTSKEFNSSIFEAKRRLKAKISDPQSTHESESRQLKKTLAIGTSQDKARERMAVSFREPPSSTNKPSKFNEKARESIIQDRNQAPPIGDTAVIPQEVTRITTPYDIFMMRVTVTGLYDWYLASNQFLRAMWTLSLVIMLGFMIRDLHLVVRRQYSGPITTDITIHFDQQPPFPNISICIPAPSNQTMMKDLVNQRLSQKIKNKLAKMKVNIDRFVEDLIVFATLSSNRRNLDRNLIPLLDSVLNDLLFNVFNGTADGFRRMLPTCQQSFSKCIVGDTIIDCCQFAVFLFGNNGVCYKLMVENALQFAKSNTTTPLATGISFRVALDWRHVPFLNDDAADGFEVHVGSTVNYFGAPDTVPTGVEAVINIHGVRQYHRLHDCFPEGKTPQLEFMDYYDDLGMNCLFESGNHVVYLGFQCYGPIGTFAPNETIGCTGIPAYIMGQVASDEFASLGNSEEISQRVFGKSVRDMSKDFLSTARCLPKCDQWTYRTTTSFAPFSKTLDKSARNEVAWSSIEAFFGDTFYEERAEEPPLSSYVTYYNVGSVLILYAGISSVTFVQFVFYGMHWCLSEKSYTGKWLKRRMQKNRVAPT